MNNRPSDPVSGCQMFKDKYGYCPSPLCVCGKNGGCQKSWGAGANYNTDFDSIENSVEEYNKIGKIKRLECKDKRIERIESDPQEFFNPKIPNNQIIHQRILNKEKERIIEKIKILETLKNKVREIKRTLQNIPSRLTLNLYDLFRSFERIYESRNDFINDEYMFESNVENANNILQEIRKYMRDHYLEFANDDDFNNISNEYILIKNMFDNINRYLNINSENIEQLDNFTKKLLHITGIHNMKLLYEKLKLFYQVNKLYKFHVLQFLEFAKSLKNNIIYLQSNIEEIKHKIESHYILSELQTFWNNISDKYIKVLSDEYLYLINNENLSIYDVENFKRKVYELQSSYVNSKTDVKDIYLKVFRYLSDKELTIDENQLFDIIRYIKNMSINDYQDIGDIIHKIAKKN